MKPAARASIVRSMLLAAIAVHFGGDAFAQSSQAPLARLQFDIIGVRLVVDPPALTVPKNIATQINTSLVTPPGLAADVSDALASLTEGAQVEAELRGPSISPTRIAVVPGQPLPIPPLALAGDYFLDGIRLVKNGQTVLDATSADGHPATTIPIHVINEVFVASVTSKPLSLDEIRGKGIVIDEKNFSAVNFQVAFNIDGAPFTIQAPAVLPTPQLLQTTKDRTEIIKQVSALNRSLAATQTTLPPQFDRPGLNFSIAALPFFPVESGDNNDPGFDTPPVTGLIVIPGNVAFLHQFFSALLLVANVAPDGSRLELQNVTGTIVLPKGLDRVAGTFDQPGDDPLRLARIEGVGIQPTVQIVQRGPDGKLGTADDIPVLPPQKQGEGEFLVEGLQEGSHLFDITIRTTLVGLPSGPVQLEGQASGAVFVRNPTFAVTLAHPQNRTQRRAVRRLRDRHQHVAHRGEPCEPEPGSAVHHRGAAALGSHRVVRLDRARPVGRREILVARAAHGRRHVHVVHRRRRARRRHSSRDRRRRTRRSACRQRHRAPAVGRCPASVPHRRRPARARPGVQRRDGARRGVARGRALRQAADGRRSRSRARRSRRACEVRRSASACRAGSAARLAGQHGLDEGFDQILRTTEAGKAFLTEVAAVLGPDEAARGAFDYQRQFAQAAASRSGHLSAIASSASGTPPTLTVTSGSSGTVPDAEGGASSIVSGVALALGNAGAAARFAVVGHPAIDRYTFELRAPAGGLYDLGIVVPGAAPGRLQQLTFGGVALDAGGVERVTIDLASPGSPTLSVDRNGDGSAERSLSPATVDIADAPPQLLAFDSWSRPPRTTQAGWTTRPRTDCSSPRCSTSRSLATRPSRRRTIRSTPTPSSARSCSTAAGSSYLYLQKPVGALTPRSLTVSGIADERNQSLGTTTQPIVMTLADGAHVFGQVRDAGGAGIGGGILKLAVNGDGEVLRCRRHSHRRAGRIRLRLRRSPRRQFHADGPASSHARHRVAVGAHPRRRRAVAVEPDVPRPRHGARPRARARRHVDRP